MKTGKASKSVASYLTASALEKLTYKSVGGKEPGEKYISLIQIVEMNKIIYVVAENSYAITVSSSNGGGHTTDYHQELIVSKLNSEGSVEWTRVIPRSAGSRETGALSDETASTKYNFVINGNKMNFIYLDHPKNVKKYTLDNFEPGEFGSVQGIRGPNLICVSLDASGNAERNVLHENEDFCAIPQMEDVLLNKKNLIIYMKQGGDEKFGLIQFE
jgi:hypothetical protein